MSHEYQVGSSRFQLEIDGPAADPKSIQITPVDEGGAAGEPTTLDARLDAINDQTFLLTCDGRRRVARMVRGKDAIHVWVGGRTYQVIPPEVLEKDRRRGAAVDLAQHVTPPMPGQVIKIVVEVGDRVEAGQAIVVISAMKMETNLAAPFAGEVSAINTEIGAQVMPGDILVDIEPAA